MHYIFYMLAFVSQVSTVAHFDCINHFWSFLHVCCWTHGTRLCWAVKETPFIHTCYQIQGQANKSGLDTLSRALFLQSQTSPTTNSPAPPTSHQQRNPFTTLLINTSWKLGMIMWLICEIEWKWTLDWPVVLVHWGPFTLLKYLGF